MLFISISNLFANSFTKLFIIYQPTRKLSIAFISSFYNEKKFKLTYKSRRA